MWSTLLLGAIVLAEGVGKLAEPHGYFAALPAFHAFPPGLNAPLGTAWMALEIATGLGLLMAARGLRRLGTLAALGALLDALAYALLLSITLARGLSVDNCTCFGVFWAQRLSGWALLQDASMLGFSALQLRKFYALPHGARLLGV